MCRPRRSSSVIRAGSSWVMLRERGHHAPSREVLRPRSAGSRLSRACTRSRRSSGEEDRERMVPRVVMSRTRPRLVCSRCRDAPGATETRRSAYEESSVPSPYAVVTANGWAASRDHESPDGKRPRPGWHKAHGGCHPAANRWTIDPVRHRVRVAPPGYGWACIGVGLARSSRRPVSRTTEKRQATASGPKRAMAQRLSFGEFTLGRAIRILSRLASRPRRQGPAAKRE